MNVALAMAATWATAFVTYGAALVLALRSRHSAPRFTAVLVAVQSVAALTMAELTAHQLDRTGVGLLAGVGLLVIVAAQLPHLFRLRHAATWIALQTLAASLLVGRDLMLPDVLTYGLGTAGFQLFACMTTSLMLREWSARADAARANAELHATQALLAEHTRARERLRIARDLHDTIGHHLTALSLQLEVSSRTATGTAAAHVGRAHAIARLLLADVRSVVGEMRSSGQIDVTPAIRTLADSIDALRIHVEIPDRLMLDDGARAHALVRCVQEIITNTSRHANAANLWISIHPGPEGVTLHARDDGQGADTLACGNGLTGMRERFVEYSGRIEFGAKAGEGFEVRGVMPTGEAVS